MAKKAPKYDYSTVGNARREAIRALDEYGCTVAEQCAMFGHGKGKPISQATFHRFALDVRLLRRPSKPFSPGCRDEPRDELDEPPEEELSIPPSDSLEIAVLALLRARPEYDIKVIVEALGTSKSTVYRMRKAWLDRRGDLSEAEKRWRHRHIPSNMYQHSLDLMGYYDRITRRHVSRSRSTGG